MLVGERGAMAAYAREGDARVTCASTTKKIMK